MPKITYNPLEGSFDYINKSEDFKGDFKPSSGIWAFASSQKMSSNSVRLNSCVFSGSEIVSILEHHNLTGSQLHNPKGIHYAEDMFFWNSHFWHNSSLIWDENASGGRWKPKISGESFDHTLYITSTNSVSRFADSSNIRYRFPGSSNVNRALINSISSNIDTRVDSLFNWSSNKSWYANSSNVRFRFPASSTALAKYLASSAFKRNNWDSNAWHNSSISWDKDLFAWKAKKSGSTGGASNLSELTINTDKDWLTYSIYNATSISAQRFSGGAYYTSENAPTLDRQLANKKYVDDTLAAAGGFDASDYITSTNSIIRFADSSNIHYKFKASSGTWKFVSSQNISGGVIKYRDSRGYANNLGNLTTALAEMSTDILLDKSRSELTCADSQLTYTLIAQDGYGIWNISGVIYGAGVASADIVLKSGTAINPKTNYVYFDLTAGVPTLKVSETDPDLISGYNNVCVATFIVGGVSGSNYHIYGYNRHRDETETFIHRTIERISDEGTLYLSGYAPSCSATRLHIGADGHFYNGIFKMYSNNLVSGSGGFFFVNSDGEFIESNTIASLNEYSNGTSLGATHRQNIVWGVVPTTTTSAGLNPTVVRLVAVLQNEPTVAYTTDAQARQDAYDATNYYPPNDELKKIFVPVMKTIARPSVPTFISFDTGIYYKDIRGKITTGGGAATSTDLSNYYTKSESQTNFRGSSNIWTFVSSQNISGQLLNLHNSRDINNWNSHNWHNSGLIWHETLNKWLPKPSGGGEGGASNLSELTIDTDKDWNSKSIYNLKSVSSQSISSSTYKGIIDKIGITIDGGGGVIPSGIKGDSYVPYNCRINQAITYATPSGSIYIDIWKDTQVNYPPTDADKICGDNQIRVSSNSSVGVISSNNSLTGWTTTISDGDILRYRVSSARFVKRATVNLRVQRT